MCSIILRWWGRRDLNPHGINSQRILSPLRLPVPPRPHFNGGSDQIRTDGHRVAVYCLSHLATEPCASYLSALLLYEIPKQNATLFLNFLTFFKFLFFHSCFNILIFFMWLSV